MRQCDNDFIELVVLSLFSLSTLHISCPVVVAFIALLTGELALRLTHKKRIVCTFIHFNSFNLKEKWLETCPPAARFCNADLRSSSFCFFSFDKSQFFVTVFDSVLLS